jgi:hypothetical protein
MLYLCRDPRLFGNVQLLRQSYVLYTLRCLLSFLRLLWLFHLILGRQGKGGLLQMVWESL